MRRVLGLLALVPLAVLACGKSSPRQGTPVVAGTTGGSGAGIGGTAASGRGGASAGEPGTTNGGSAGNAGGTTGGSSGSAGAMTGGSAGSEMGGAGGSGGTAGSGATSGASGATAGDGGEGGTPELGCQGSYDVCGCGCCAEPTSAGCYYPERGDDLTAIMLEDREAAMHPSCANAGCSSGLRLMCCETGEVEEDATYTMVGWSSDTAHLGVTRTGPDNRCTVAVIHWRET